MEELKGIQDKFNNTLNAAVKSAKKSPRLRAELTSILREADISITRLMGRFDTQYSLELLTKHFEESNPGDIAEKARRITEIFSKCAVSAQVSAVNILPQFASYQLYIPKSSNIDVVKLEKSVLKEFEHARINLDISRNIITVDIPNETKGLLDFAQTLPVTAETSPEPLSYLAGINTEGQRTYCDLAKQPGLLISGESDSGKSTFLYTVLLTLLYRNDTRDLRFVVLDPKGKNRKNLEGIPYLLFPIANREHDIVQQIKWLRAEMEWRYEMFAKYSVQTIDEYNNKYSAPMPHVVVITEGLADVLAAGSEVESALMRILQLGRAAGVNVIATAKNWQKIPENIMANMVHRISFLGGVNPKAVHLLGSGDAILDSGKIIDMRIQAPFVDDTSASVVTGALRELDPVADYLLRTFSQNQDFYQIAQQDSKFRAVIGQAIERKTIDTPFLQRRLMWGYGRASRCMEWLESVGAMKQSRDFRMREMLVRNMDEFDAVIARIEL